MIESELQFLDNSIVNPLEISNASYWDFGDSEITDYIFAQNPLHTYSDTGVFTVVLNLINQGGCTDSFAIQVCVTPDNKLFAPNSFTPNSDYCNDEYYVKGVGGFYSFNIQIHKRWGSEVVFESNEIVLTNHTDDGNICNNLENTEPYYKMGTWDGIMLDGNLAPQGVYPFIIEYKQAKGSPSEIIVGHITLIR